MMQKSMKCISTPNAPVPGGHYSQAVAFQNLLFISGQLAVDPTTGEKKNGNIEQQTLVVLQNMEAILNAAHTSKENVLKTTIYISDISLWGKVNEVYKGFFGLHKPARAVVPSKELHHGFLIELEAIAAIV
jgi:2-iminobutanoate/2-iminopropanoate deaminase